MGIAITSVRFVMDTSQDMTAFNQLLCQIYSLSKLVIANAAWKFRNDLGHTTYACTSEACRILNRPMCCIEEGQRAANNKAGTNSSAFLS